MKFGKFFLLSFFCAILALVAVSCAHYTLGNDAQPLPFSTVYVKPVVNKSFAPQTAQMVSSKLAEFLSQTPNLRLVSEDEAQAVLEVVLVDYFNRPYATRADDTALAASFSHEIVAKCTLYKSDGTYLFKDKTVKYRAISYIERADPALGGGGGNAQGPEYQAMSELARGLARRVADEALGIW